MARLFFAVWPDAAAANALATLAPRLADVAGGKAVPGEKVHLTLAFLGQVATAQRDTAIEIARGIRAARFAMAIDRVGAFRRARVAWAGPSSPPRELAALQSQLADRLRAQGFALDERAFSPHVTLVRKVTRSVPGASIEPIAWPVDAFTLVRSETGTGRYVVEERWGLGG